MLGFLTFKVPRLQLRDVIVAEVQVLEVLERDERLLGDAVDLVLGQVQARQVPVESSTIQCRELRTIKSLPYELILVYDTYARFLHPLLPP